MKKDVTNYMDNLRREYYREPIDTAIIKVDSVMNLMHKSLDIRKIKSKKYNDQRHMFNSIMFSLEEKLHSFIKGIAEKWIHNDFTLSTHWHSVRSKNQYTLKGPLPIGKYKPLFDELNFKGDFIFLTNYEWKWNLDSRFPYDAEQKERKKSDYYTRIVFPKSSVSTIPWNLLEKRVFKHVQNGGKDISHYNFDVKYLEIENKDAADFQEIRLISKELKDGDKYERYVWHGYNVSVLVKTRVLMEGVEYKTFIADF